MKFLNVFYFFLVEIICTLPQEIKNPGLVVLLSKECKHSKMLVKFLNANKIPYIPIYIEDNKEARNYVLTKFDSKIPWVYQDGALIGDGYTYMKKYTKHKDEDQLSFKKNLYH